MAFPESQISILILFFYENLYFSRYFENVYFNYCVIQDFFMATESSSVIDCFPSTKVIPQNYINDRAMCWSYLTQYWLLMFRHCDD